MPVRPIRRSVRLHVEVVRERDFRRVARRTLDMSIEGLSAIVERPVLTGEPLVLAFRAPLSGAWIDAEAVVARVMHGRRAIDAGLVTIGVAFESMDAATRDRLARELGFFAALKSHRRAA